MHNPPSLFFFCSLVLSCTHIYSALETELSLIKFIFLLSGLCAEALVHIDTYRAIHSFGYMKPPDWENLLLRL